MTIKLLDQVRETARLKHLSLRTEEAYVQWIKHFILFHKKGFRWRWLKTRYDNSLHTSYKSNMCLPLLKSKVPSVRLIIFYEEITLAWIPAHLPSGRLALE
jgi:hypothetical protein